MKQNTLTVNVARITRWQYSPDASHPTVGLAVARFTVTHGPYCCNGHVIIPTTLDKERGKTRTLFVLHRHNTTVRNCRPFDDVLTELLCRFAMMWFDQCMTDTVPGTVDKVYRDIFNDNLLTVCNAALIDSYFRQEGMCSKEFRWYNHTFYSMFTQRLKDATYLKRPQPVIKRTFEFERFDPDAFFPELAQQGRFKTVCRIASDVSIHARTFELFDTGTPWPNEVPYLRWTVPGTRHEVTMQRVKEFFEPYVPLLRMVQLYLFKTVGAPYLNEHLDPMLMGLPYPVAPDEQRLCVFG